MTIDFDSNLHIYRVDGIIRPSVTQVLEDVGIIDYSFLPAGVREMALERGRQVHQITHFDDEGDLDESTVNPSLLPYLAAWRKYNQDHENVPWNEIEKAGYHSLGFAGTYDRLRYYASRSLVEVVDIKTNEIPWWVRLQLAAYAAIIIERFPISIAVKRTAVALHSDGTYAERAFPIGDRRHDFNEFLSAFNVYQTKAAKAD